MVGRYKRWVKKGGSFLRHCSGICLEGLQKTTKSLRRTNWPTDRPISGRSVCFIIVTAVKAYREPGGKTPLILDLEIKWMWVISITLATSLPRGLCPVHIGLEGGELQSRSWRGEKFLPLLGIRPHLSISGIFNGISRLYEVIYKWLWMLSLDGLELDWQTRKTWNKLCGWNLNRTATENKGRDKTANRGSAL